MALNKVLCLVSCLSLVLSACAPTIYADAGAEDASVADANSDDAHVETAYEHMSGVWELRLQSYPDLILVWSLSPGGWGNVDAKGSSGSWCRNYVSWEILSETSATAFALAYTFEEQPCGDSNVGDTLSFNGLGVYDEEPYTLLCDWGGGALMRLCGRDLGATDPCQNGNSLGVPARVP